MIAVEAQDHGEFTMIPVIAPGKRLKINAVTFRAGWVKVEVAGVKGRAMADCVPIVGDHHWSEVKWNGKIARESPRGSPWFCDSK